MNASTTIQASPAKLRSGDWGARIKGTASEGDVIQITTKAGKSWEATVSKVIWKGDGVTLVATTKTSGESRRGYTPAIRNARGYVVERGHYDGYCGYDCPVSGRKCCPSNGPCHDCM